MMMEKAGPDGLRKRLGLMAMLCLFLPGMASAVPFGLRKDGRLDMHALRNAYQESEFEKVSAVLEAYLKRNSPPATREERIFAYKHLGVIHAHVGLLRAEDPSSQARAESYFNQLVEMAPNIELVDMYAPPNIQDLFDRVKREHRAKQEYRRQYDEFGNPVVARPPDTSAGHEPKPHRRKQPEARARSSRAWVYWTLGAVAVGAGVGAYIWHAREKRTERIDVK